MCNIFAKAWRCATSTPPPDFIWDVRLKVFLIIPNQPKSLKSYITTLVYPLDAYIGSILTSLGLLYAMPRRIIDTTSRARAVHLLHAHWKPAAIATQLYCHQSTVYRWEQRLQAYRTIDIVNPLPVGRSRRIAKAAKEALLEYQRQKPWAYQDELAIFLEEEWDIYVNRSTISRFLKSSGISRK